MLTEGGTGIAELAMDATIAAITMVLISTMGIHVFIAVDEFGVAPDVFSAVEVEMSVSAAVGVASEAEAYVLPAVGVASEAEA